MSCGKVFNRPGGVKNHFWRKHTEAGLKFKPYRGYKEGRCAWNKGMTLKTHPHLEEQLCKGGRALGIKVLAGLVPNHNKKQKTPEWRLQQSDRKKELYKKFPEKHPNRRLAGNKKKMSFPEKLVYEFLQSLGVSFEHQKPTLGLFPDFTLGMKILEIDGHEWHLDKEKDLRRDQRLINEGYQVIRIPAAPAKTLLARVQEILKTFSLVES